MLLLSETQSQIAVILGQEARIWKRSLHQSCFESLVFGARKLIGDNVLVKLCESCTVNSIYLIQSQTVLNQGFGAERCLSYSDFGVWGNPGWIS